LEAKFRKPPGGALPPGLVVPVEEVWDRRRGRERETYTLQGYSPVLGNRPPEYLLGVLSSLPLAGLHPDDSLLLSLSEPTAAEAGALLFYGPDVIEGCSRAAKYVDRILQGAKPADLPVEQPTKITMMINLKTAKTFSGSCQASFF